MHAPIIPYVSILTAAIVLAMQVLLMAPVIWLRRTGKTSLGDGGRPELEAAIRRHGNLAENGAIFVVALALLEMSGGRVVVPAAIFVAARLCHAIGLSLPSKSNIFRTLGIVGTVGVGLVLAARLAMVALRGL